MSDEADILAVCAHPDDAELVMGGTIIRATARSQRVVMVDLTRGESGSRGTPEIRERESQAAARILGVAHRESLGLPDSALQPVPEQRDRMVEALRRLRPKVVLLQHWKQRHPDHAAASRIVYDASFVAGLKSYRPDLGAAWRPRKLCYAVTMTEANDLRPSFVVDITDHWETKMKAIAAFESQFVPAAGETGVLPLDRFKEAVELSGRRHGQRIGVRYGEGFVTREPLQVDDVVALAGESI